MGLRTHFGQRWFDQAKLAMRVLDHYFERRRFLDLQGLWAPWQVTAFRFESLLM